MHKKIDLAEIPEILLRKKDKLPTQITFVIAYSCALEDCNIREALEALEGWGSAEIVDAAFQYDDDDISIDRTGLVEVK